MFFFKLQKEEGEREGRLDAGIPSERGDRKTLETVGCLTALGWKPGVGRALWYGPVFVSLDKSLSFSQPWFTHLQNGETTAISWWS